ncbi:MAG: hypothetical protein LQ351_003043 [Letrouitia transgressa]|nr:MAG: hypothetical protein LQ351_003043 [Letrouitia transgressa]
MSFRYCAASYVRDPTSYFFDETKAYQRLYSLQREHEALELLRAANRSGVSESRQSDSPSMCVGVATISRPSKDQYVKGTIGSLLEGLTETQRREIFLMPFIAHTDPSVHPIYREPWLKAVSDKILEYEVDEDEMARLRMLEEDHHPRNKSMFDYGYLLSHCLQTGARFVAVIEDDVIAKAGWYTDAMLALQEIQSQVGETGWLYLRMFYTEGLLGWNSEEWPRYLGWSLIALVILLSGLMGARTCSPRLQRHLSNVNIAILCFVCLPGFIGLYFMAGRVSMQPPHPGVRKMSRFGCCSQGFIFPRQIVSRTIERTKRAMFEDYYIDMLLERWADAEDLARFAIFPSLLQHVGIKSSKGWGYDEHAGTTWNFQFETLSP